MPTWPVKACRVMRVPTPGSRRTWTPPSSVQLQLHLSCTPCIPETPRLCAPHDPLEAQEVLSVSHVAGEVSREEGEFIGRGWGGRDSDWSLGQSGVCAAACHLDGHRREGGAQVLLQCGAADTHVERAGGRHRGDANARRAEEEVSCPACCLGDQEEEDLHSTTWRHCGRCGYYKGAKRAQGD